jgi:hypothetical protein
MESIRKITIETPKRVGIMLNVRRMINPYMTLRHLARSQIE